VKASQPGAWTSQDAFAHRTQGLLNAGMDRAIWIGTLYMGPRTSPGGALRAG
jgi:hypothetical protein